MYHFEPRAARSELLLYVVCRTCSTIPLRYRERTSVRPRREVGPEFDAHDVQCARWNRNARAREPVARRDGTSAGRSEHTRPHHQQRCDWPRNATPSMVPTQKCPQFRGVITVKNGQKWMCCTGCNPHTEVSYAGWSQHCLKHHPDVDPKTRDDHDARATASKAGNKDNDGDEPKKRLRNGQGVQEARIPQPKPWRMPSLSQNPGVCQG